MDGTPTLRPLPGRALGLLPSSMSSNHNWELRSGCIRRVCNRVGTIHRLTVSNVSCAPYWRPQFSLVRPAAGRRRPSTLPPFVSTNRLER
jgi:hypothetical protein